MTETKNVPYINSSIMSLSVWKRTKKYIF